MVGNCVILRKLSSCGPSLRRKVVREAHSFFVASTEEKISKINASFTSHWNYARSRKLSWRSRKFLNIDKLSISWRINERDVETSLDKHWIFKGEDNELVLLYREHILNKYLFIVGNLQIRILLILADVRKFK